jgi:hypothetical protein
VDTLNEVVAGAISDFRKVAILADAAWLRWRSIYQDRTAGSSGHNHDRPRHEEYHQGASLF